MHPPPVLRAPFYRPGNHLALHRYLDDEFVPTFLDDLASGALAQATQYTWLDQERMGAHRDHPTLRLPLHRTFHLVSCEVACAVPGNPAFDPAKIRSAGVVIRRTPRGGAMESWQVERDLDVGWSDRVDPGDPDHHRRLRQVLPQADTRTPPYSGERSYPLHVVTAHDANGRRHTVLYGFLPVGGGSSNRPRAGRPRIAAADLAAAKNAMAQELPWPFGLDRRAPLSDSRQVTNGRPTRALLALLRTLVHRHRLGLDPTRDNATLVSLVGTLRFRTPPRFDGLGRELPPAPPATASLKTWLDSFIVTDTEAPTQRAYAGALLRYLDLPLADNLAESPIALPTSNGGTLDLHLDVADNTAAALRTALVDQVAARATQLADDIPLPRYGQDVDDLYIAQAFVRYGDEACEHTVVGELTTVPFRVASPFTPEAIRPVLIQLPKFSDLKRGLMNAHFLAPDDLAQKILSLRIGKPLEVSQGSGPGFNLCWLFSFSIPAITICAMILLMIIISILNIIFFWIPYIFITLPFFCKRR
jgi:hypothetical protein